MSILYEKMAQAGFTPSQRALEADEYIKTRNRFDHPDEFQYVGSMGGPDGYMYIGPARFYTSGTEYAGWLNSGLGQGAESYADGNAVAQAIDDNPAVPEGPFGPISEYKTQTSSNNNGMFTGQQEPDRTTQIPSFCPSGFKYPDGTCVPMDEVIAAQNSNNTTSGSTATSSPAGPTRASVADINALYQKYLGRDARQAGLDYWMNSGGTLADLEYNISISPEAQEYAASQQQTNQQTNQQTRASVADINALYQKYLGRDAKQSGLDYWRSTGQYADRGIQSLADIEYNISISDEAQQYAASQQDSTSTQPTRASIEDVTRLYQQYLGRNPLQAGLDYWRSTGEYADRGIQSLEDIEYNISISDEAQKYAASQAQTGTGSTTGVSVGGGAFTSGTPQGLSYTPMQLPSVAPAPSIQNVDYVKMLRGALTNSLFKDII